MKQYYYDPKNPDIFENFRWPIFCGFITLLAFASTQFPDSIIKRPLPVFWRIIMGALVGYSMFMTFIFTVPID
jgi:hypothetical protein